MQQLPTAEQLRLDPRNYVVLPIFFHVMSDGFLWTRWSGKSLHPLYTSFLGVENAAPQLCMLFPSLPFSAEKGYGVPPDLEHDLFHACLDVFFREIIASTKQDGLFIFQCW